MLDNQLGIVSSLLTGEALTRIGTYLQSRVYPQLLVSYAGARHKPTLRNNLAQFSAAMHWPGPEVAPEGIY